MSSRRFPTALLRTRILGKTTERDFEVMDDIWRHDSIPADTGTIIDMVAS